jgi:hypothetical protein
VIFFGTNYFNFISECVGYRSSHATGQQGYVRYLPRASRLWLQDYHVAGLDHEVRRLWTWVCCWSAEQF